MGQWPALGYLPYTNFYFSFCLQELNLILIKPQRYKSLRTKVTNKPDRYVTPYLKSLNNNFNANSFAQLKLKKKLVCPLNFEFYIIHVEVQSRLSIISLLTFGAAWQQFWREPSACCQAAILIYKQQQALIPRIQANTSVLLIDLDLEIKLINLYLNCFIVKLTFLIW